MNKVTIILILLIIVFSITIIIVITYADKELMSIFKSDSNNVSPISKNQIIFEPNVIPNKWYILSITGNESLLYNVSIEKDNVCITPKFTKIGDLTLGKEIQTCEHNVLQQVVCETQIYKYEGLPVRNEKEQIDTIDKLAIQTAKDFKYCYYLNRTKSLLYKFGYGTIIIAGDASYNSTNTDVVQESVFTHVNISNTSFWNNLVAYWAFDGDDSSVANDYQKNSLNGAPSSSGTIKTNCNSGLGKCSTYFGSALSDYITISSSPVLNISQNMTVCFWMNATLTAGDAYIISKSTFPDNDWGIYLVGWSNTVMVFATGTPVESSYTFQKSRWQFICAVFNATKTTIYINNNSQVRDPLTINAAGGCTLMFGRNAASASYPFVGDLDEVMIFNTYLNNSQILEIYNNQSNRFKSSGDMLFKNLNFGINDTLNLSIKSAQNLMGSNISIKFCNGAQCSTEANLTNGNISNYDIAGITDLTNLNLTIKLLAGTNKFYSPIVKGNITIDSWRASDIIQVSTCQELNISNGKYALTANIVNYTGTCFSVVANNITFAGQNKFIDGDYSGTYDGFLVSASNFTASNFNITDFANGIHLSNTNLSRFINYTIVHSVISLNIESSPNSLFENFYHEQSSDSDILIQNSPLTIFRNGLINANGVAFVDGMIYFNSESGSSTDTTIQNISILSTNRELYYDINSYAGSMDGVKIIDTYLYQYNLAEGKMIFNNTRYGQIKFLSGISGTGYNLSDDIRIENNSVYVTPDVSGLNKPANITLLGLSQSFTNPYIDNNGSRCANCYNFTSLNAGNILFNVSTMLGNYSIVSNITSDFYPTFSGELISPNNNSQYKSSFTLALNITITYSNGTTGIELNKTNYTLTNNGANYGKIFTELSAGTYQYYYWSYGSGASHYYNKTLMSYYTIAKNTTYNITITGTTPIIYGITSDFAGSGCPSQISCSMDRSNGVFGVGTWVFNYSTSGNNNYTGKSTTKDLTVNKATGVVYTWINNTRSNSNYYNGTAVLLNSTLFTGRLGSLNLTVNGSQVNYSTTGNLSYIYTFNVAGTYVVKTNYSGNQNYTDAYEQWNAIISVHSPPSTGGNATICRYKKFGFYNPHLPFFREVNCV